MADSPRTSLAQSQDDDASLSSSFIGGDGVSGSPSLTRDLGFDLHNPRAITAPDLQETARAAAAVFDKHNIPYAFCGGWEMIQFGVKGRSTNDLDCVVGKGFGICTHVFENVPGWEVGGHLSDGVQRLKYTLPSSPSNVVVTVDLLRSGEFGPRDLRAPGRTVVLADGLTYLSPTEMLRVKVKAFNARGGQKNKSDILWIFANQPELLDGDRIDPIGNLTEIKEMDQDIGDAFEKWRNEHGRSDENEEDESQD